MSVSHESIGNATKVEPGSDRSFGLVFSILFAVIASLPLLSGESVRPWALAVSALFLVAALAVPRVLRPLNRLWFRFGLVLHRVMTPVVMGLLFFVAVTPTAMVMRLRGKDPLRLSRQPDACSYWIARQPPGPPPDSMRRQY